MNPDTTYTRMLRLAIKVAGDETKLAEKLRTSPDVLGKWLAGELQPPNDAFLKALEMVVNGTGAWGANRRS